MKIIVTYNDLFFYVRELETFEKNFPAVSLILGEKIKRFYQLNNLRIQALTSTLDKLRKEYIQHDEKGQAIRVEVEKGKHEWKFKKDSDIVINPRDYESEYYSKATPFLQTPVEVFT